MSARDRNNIPKTGYASASVSATPPDKTEPITIKRVLEEQEKALEYLNNSLYHLFEKIEPVLAGEADSGGAVNSAAPSPRSPIAQFIKLQTERIDSMAARVREFAGRVDL